MPNFFISEQTRIDRSIIRNKTSHGKILSLSAGWRVWIPALFMIYMHDIFQVAISDRQVNC